MHGKFPGMEHRSCCVPSSSQKKHGEIQFVRIDRQKAYHDGIPKKKSETVVIFPKDPITLSDDDWGV